MKKLVVILSIAWLGAGIGAAYLWHELDTLRDGNVALQAQVTALEARAQMVVANVPQTLVIDAPAAAAAAPAAVPAPPTVATQAAPNKDEQEFKRTMLRMTLTQRYPDLGKQLGLAPNELDRFEDLLVSQQMSKTFGRSAEEQSAVEQLLGANYPKWQAYQDTLPGRQQVTLLRDALAASGSTLTDAQAKPLMAALNAEMKRIDQEPNVIPGQPAVSEEEMNKLIEQSEAETGDRLVKAATPYLNSQQLGSYRNMLDQQLKMGRMAMDAMSSTQNGGGTTR